MNRELQALLDACVDAVIIIDHRGLIDTFNPAACRMFGYTATEAVGRRRSSGTPQRKRCVKCAIGSRMSHGFPPWVK